METAPEEVRALSLALLADEPGSLLSALLPGRPVRRQAPSADLSVGAALWDPVRLDTYGVLQPGPGSAAAALMPRLQAADIGAFVVSHFRHSAAEAAVTALRACGVTAAALLHGAARAALLAALHEGGSQKCCAQAS